MRRALCPFVLAAVLLGSATAAQADAPAGPRLAFVRLIERRAPADDPLDLMTTDPSGEAPQLVTGTTQPGGVSPVYGFGWSPDGQTLAIGAQWEREDLQSLLTSDEFDLFLAAADGTGLRQLTDFPDIEDGVSVDAVLPVFSRDGGTVFFAKLTGVLRSSIWAVGVDGSALRQLTPDRRGTSIDLPSSSSPNGEELAFTRIRCAHWFKGCRSSAIAISLTTGAERLIAKRALQPAYSPDGARVAFGRYGRHKPNIVNEALPATDLYVLDTANGGMRRLTRTRKLTEGEPSWDPSGQRMAFTRGTSSGLLDASGVPPRILESNADGSCPTVLFRKAVRDHSFFGASYGFPGWQPGPGREAGRIAC